VQGKAPEDLGMTLSTAPFDFGPFRLIDYVQDSVISQYVVSLMPIDGVAQSLANSADLDVQAKNYDLSDARPEKRAIKKFRSRFMPFDTDQLKEQVKFRSFASFCGLLRCKDIA
jgi:hypothetical protein